MSGLMEDMKRKIDDLGKRLDQMDIHNQVHGAAVWRQGSCCCHVVGAAEEWVITHRIAVLKGAQLTAVVATELKGPSSKYLQQLSSSLLHWVAATQCNGPACNCYGVVDKYRARSLFDSDSTTV
ncbi:hypothetical protein T4E_7545 [Trichinella pseudospiralis]|uniref:Uncharacterized protein n=1 Tax=Trichinella pseudospiralis TaxID=6337 RepID=A0A0V0YKV8_TRIPS|nr:hypothetical protein T4E_7545 [Trichinella pseudospiralis]